MKRPIIIDCDPGHDDAVALMLAQASPELELLGVTVVFGNVGLERTLRNTRVVRELLGGHFPIHAGADRPLLVPRISAEAVHGLSGLEGPHLPEPQHPVADLHAVQFIIEQVMARPGQITLVPTGPLTNIALALRLEPRLQQNVREIVLMGGSVDLGNWSPAAEFNILADPHAAQIVFSSGIPLVMFGLNLTHQAIATPARIARFRALGSLVGQVAAELLEFFAEHHQERYGWEGGALHDPCTVAYLLAPELFETRSMFVEVDVTNGPNQGRTVCDYWRVTGQTPNTQVAISIDADSFFDLLVDRLGYYGL